MSEELDLDNLKKLMTHIDGDSPCDHIRCMYALVSACPLLIADVERLRQRVTQLIESNNIYEQQARDARKAHAANGKILEAVQLALVRSEEEAEGLEKKLATAKRVGAAECAEILEAHAAQYTSDDETSMALSGMLIKIAAELRAEVGE